jgi:ribonuclease-3
MHKSPIENRIGYKFRNSLLLAEALTHPSLGYETQRHHFDNQRLEFLGDAVLQLVFTRHLYDSFPKCSEGELTKRRSRLVSREALKNYALSIELGEFLRLGKGEESTGGRERSTALADALEALLGAMYLDGGMEVVRDFVLKISEPDMQNLELEPLHVNPKGRLQEILQAVAHGGPKYLVISETGPEHMKTFVSAVTWNGQEIGRGQGNSKKEAEIHAAFDALQKELWKTCE